MKKKQTSYEKIKTLLSVLLVAAGIILMLYPFISNKLYENAVESTVNVYENSVMDTGDGLIEDLLMQAKEYNEELSQSQVTLTDPFLMEEEAEESLLYDKQLVVDDSGIMCFVEIPKIDVYLPVYHGTSEEVLMKGIGHIEGSTLPIGGEGTHAVLSGHTGIDKAKIFTDLTEMEKDDLFFIHVLGQILAYRVYSINVIEPEDTSNLIIVPGEDLVSLLTCTPYGVNTHRLVVTGKRTTYREEVLEEAKEEKPDHASQWQKAYTKALLLGGLISGTLFFILILLRRFREKKKL